MRNAMMLVAGLLLSFGAHAEPSGGTVFVDSRLLVKPAFDAGVRAEVPADTRVTVDEEKGLWLRVTLDDGSGKQGWIRRFDVRMAGAGKAKRGDSGGGGLLGLFSGGSRKESRVTDTIGIRGLDSVDINNARSDPREVQLLDTYRATPAAAERLADAGGLTSRDVAYPEGVPEAPRSGGGSGGGGNPMDLNF